PKPLFYYKSGKFAPVRGDRRLASQLICAMVRPNKVLGSSALRQKKPEGWGTGLLRYPISAEKHKDSARLGRQVRASVRLGRGGHHRRAYAIGRFADTGEP